MSFILSSNMNLPIPGVGTESGPQYAFDVNSCLTLIDSHDHSPGRGVQITPNGLNINAALSFNNNSAIDLAGLNLTAQLGTPVLLNTIYENGVDLFFLDGVGNPVRITQNGAVAGTPGSIANLLPPASVSYVAGSKTFVFQSGTNIAANIDAASYLLRNISPNSTFALTLQPPAALGNNYSITLPLIPGSNSFITIDTSGALSGSIPTAAGIVGANIANDTVALNNLTPAVRSYIAPTVQTKTSAYTAVLGDGLILCSSSAFAVTLFTAVGNAGALIGVKKTDNSLANIITINTTGGQTINFGTSSPTSITANTIGEYWLFESDGANWQVRQHLTRTSLVSNTPTIVGFGTVTSNTQYTRRNGSMLEVWGQFTTGNPTAVLAQISLGFNGTASNVSADHLAIGSGLVGEWTSGSPSYPTSTILASKTTDNTFVNMSSPISSQIPTAPINGNSLITVSGVLVEYKFSVTVAGWID